MTVPELKALAAKHGLAHDLKAIKAILLDLLDKQRGVKRDRSSTPPVTVRAGGAVGGEAEAPAKRNPSGNGSGARAAATGAPRQQQRN